MSDRLDRRSANATASYASRNYGDKLCDVCSNIDFKRYTVRKMSRSRLMGTWGELVQNHSCSFCRLVVHSLRRNPNQALLHPNNHIVLENHPSWELGVETSPYDRLKSEAYSNMLDLRSKARQCRDVAHRFVVSVQEDPEVQALIQYIAPQDKGEEAQQFFGRILDRERADVHLIKSWMKRCEKWHDDICKEDGIAGRRLPANLRLIDVKNRTIVKAPNPETICYLTLSYVWGTEEMERETGMKPVVINREDLQFTEAGREVTPLPERLPRTIEDSISLTNSLGYRYLWVDALCIIQDDPDGQKKHHMDRMDAVYNCSALTIAAASRRHADSGIPGISVPRQFSQCSEVVDGLRLATMFPSFSELEGSQSLIWNTRGWTFQEKILAKRILLFTDFQIYFKCSESIWTEEVVMETERLSKSIETREAKYRWAADRPHYVPSAKTLMIKMAVPQLNIDDQYNYLGMFPEYASAVREYTVRTLTKPGDNLIAINGVFRTLQPDSGKFYFGLPSAYFLQALLWYPEPGSRLMRTNQMLPSWTWAGWDVSRGVSYDVLDIRMLRTIMVTLKKFFKGLGTALSSMGGGDSSSGSSSSGSSSSNYGSSSSTSSSSNSSYSSPSSSSGPCVPAKRRDWSTVSIVSRATMNVSSCFGWPLLIRDHTVKEMFLYSGGEAIVMNCGETFALSTFTEDTISEDGPSTSSETRNISTSKHRFHQKIASKTRIPLLSMRTVIVHFSIGSCIHHHPPKHETDSSVFELVDSSGLCVGEVWTTLKTAQRGQERPLEFITISWGLSLTVAQIAEEHIPCWTFDGAKLPEAKQFVKWRGRYGDMLDVMWPSKKIVKRAITRGGTQGGNGNGGEGKGDRGETEQLPAMAFFEALFKAKKGDPRPKFLWSTVNIMLIDRDGALATRVGVGRVIFGAWLSAKPRPEEVLLA